jgi:hypothetical protein
MFWMFLLAVVVLREVFAMTFSDDYLPLRASGYLFIGIGLAIALLAFGTAVGVVVSAGASLSCVKSFWRWDSDDE